MNMEPKLGEAKHISFASGDPPPFDDWSAPLADIGGGKGSRQKGYREAVFKASTLECRWRN